MTATDPRELVLTRMIDAPPSALFRAWTEPDLLVQWFAPLPWTTARATLDPRPGGASEIVMRDPEGNEFPSSGVYLEIVPDHKIVFTDAYGAGWKPAEKPFFTGIITFEPQAGGTLYTARARHWTQADCKAHEKMGFHEGWGQCADQLAALAARM